MRSLEDLQVAMAARLAEEGLAAAAAVPVRRDPQRAPLSFGQRYVWAHQQISPDSSAYNLCLALTFEGAVDAAALRKAFAALVQRHEVLRTTYHTDEDGESYQRIHAELPPRLVDEDLSGHPDAQARLRELTEAAARETFDLGAESSLRVTFARMPSGALVAVVVIQHIAWDGMTLPALSRDVENFYRQAQTGPITVKPLRLQVADFAEWEADRFAADDHAEDIRFWQSRFDGELPELHLPYDRRPVAATERGQRSDRPLSPAADAALRRLTADLRTTPFSVFLAAYYVALREMTGRTDMVIGTTVANREESGMELLIGNLSNMLPLRIAGRDEQPFAELVEQVRGVITDAFGHKHFPQEGIVRAVNAATGNVGSNLFDTMVLFLHQKIDGPQLPGATTSWELMDNGAALLPLVVETFMHGDRTDVQITYRTDLFDAVTIDRLHEYIDQVLSAATAERRVSELATLSATDRKALDEWSHGGVVPIESETTDAMIRASARDYPDRTAVVFGDIELSYREFDTRVNQLARLLLEDGVRPGDRVGVYAERSERLPIAFAAVLRAGAVYFPIDPSYPLDRVEYMLGDAEPALLLLVSADKALPVEIDVPAIDLTANDVTDRLSALGGTTLARSELHRPIHPLDAAYLLYTSGTTGRPKGVVIHHRGIVNHVQWMRDYLGFGEERILQKAPIGFDVSVFELVNALCTGSAAVLPPPDWWQADVEALAGIIHRHRITQISLVPSVVRAFIDAGPDPARLQSMRYVYLGGEAVPPALVEESSRFFGGTVLGLYGPTEGSMDLMHEDFAGRTESGVAEAGSAGGALDPALIGLPEWNSSVYVLDERLRQVPPGVIGELYLGGVQLARGYHRRPDLTAGAFVACPFAGASGARMYRTGDIVRWNARGRMEYLGRVDDQVKVRGHRIELGEIGTVLRRVPGIASAVAITVPQGEQSQDLALVAYYVPEANSEFATGGDAENNERIKAALAQRLPEYMIPAALVRLAELPLTANGKLDRRALPQPDLGGSTGNGRELREGAEAAVAQVVRTVLHLGEDTSLAADDDFLALGGDSISAIRMASALKKFGLQITTSALFDARSIARIAAACEPIVAGGGPALVEVGGRTGWIPLNPIATLLTEQSDDYHAYSQATAVVAPAHSTREQIAEVVSALAARHPMLRARLAADPEGRTAYYVPEPGEPVVAPAVAEVVVDDANWDRTAGARLDAQLKELSAHLDPAAGRMLAAAWVHSADGRQARLLLVIHHLVVDGVSWRVLHDDLRALWGVAATSVEPHAGTSVKTWNTSLGHIAKSPEVLATLPYWRAAAEAVDPLLGSRALDPAVDTVATVREVTAILDADDTAFLMGPATTAFGCDFLDIQVASLAVAIHRFRRRRDRDADAVAVTMERHGRVETLFSGVDLANTVGWFTTAYPVALQVPDAGEQVESAVKAVKEQLLAVPESGIGWGLLRWLNPETRAELAQAAAPQVSFNYMGRFAADGESARTWDAAPEFGYLGGHADPAMPAPALLDINTVALTDGDSVRLHSSFRYPAGPLSEDEVAELAQLWSEGLGELVKTVRDNPVRRLTPSDVVADEVTQLDLDRWQALYRGCVDIYPLAPLQAGLYFTALGSAGNDVYNVQTLIGVRGELDVPRLSGAFDTVLNRYPNLRVSISVSHAGQPYAVVADHLPIPVREIDFAALSDADERLRDFFRADQAEHFDLTQGPLIRVTVVHLPGEQHMVVLTSHHLLTDGWSGQLLPREIFAEYAGRGGQPLGDPDTFAKFLRLTRDREQATEAAWHDYLDGVQPCIVAPTRTPDSGGVPAGLSFALDDEVVARATELAAEQGTTFSLVCQLAWANALRYVTGEQATVFGEVVSGRPADLDGVDHAVGCFANTIPVAIDLAGDRTWRSQLAEMQRHRVDLMEYHQYRLTSAMRAAGRSNPAARKLFDSMFVFQSYPPGRDELETSLRDGGLELVSFEGGGATDNALLLMIFPANSLLPGDGVQAVVFYAEDSFDADDARIIETAFRNSLRAIAEQPDRAVADTPVLDDEDQGLLVMRRMWQ